MRALGIILVLLGVISLIGVPGSPREEFDLSTGDGIAYFLGSISVPVVLIVSGIVLERWAKAQARSKSGPKEKEIR
jgi:hypothetical protein